jgi:hypothetical protein
LNKFVETTKFVQPPKLTVLPTIETLLNGVVAFKVVLKNVFQSLNELGFETGTFAMLSKVKDNNDTE